MAIDEYRLLKNMPNNELSLQNQTLSEQFTNIEIYIKENKYVCDINITYIMGNEEIVINITEKFTKIGFETKITIDEIYDDNLFLDNTISLDNNKDISFFKKNIYFLYLMIKNCFLDKIEYLSRISYTFDLYKIKQLDFVFHKKINPQMITLYKEKNYIDVQSKLSDSDWLIFNLKFTNNNYLHNFLFILQR